MASQLRKDYAAMSGMIFGAVPEWAAIIETIEHFEKQVKAGSGL